MTKYQIAQKIGILAGLDPRILTPAIYRLAHEVEFDYINERGICNDAVKKFGERRQLEKRGMHGKTTKFHFISNLQ